MLLRFARNDDRGIARTICYFAALEPSSPGSIGHECNAQQTSCKDRQARFKAGDQISVTRRHAREKIRQAAAGPPRDFRGYGAHPPHAQWPGGARIAVNVNLNVEAGGEHCLLEGDDSVGEYADRYRLSVLCRGAQPDG